MRFQFWSMSEDSRVEILLRGSSVRVCLVVLNQGCCGSGQYNLPDRMLRLDANTTLNQSYVLFITLVNITYQSGDQYLPFLHSWDSSPWQVLYIPLFCFVCVLFVTACRVVLAFFKCITNLTSFLFKWTFISLLIFIHLFFTFFSFWLSNFSHMKRWNLVDYFVCLFCFLSWNCRVIIHNFITFFPFRKDF